uniref:Beta-1,4-mannosyl-glycoprotein beta-1,4-N-acetylglucosaminyltransferase n=1 Tax=Candidatus Kentrum sp. DK TaxID=2126562 RepID=A0A450SWV8_9GAMM|nr:MAG: beta-1,4-mannosyl-glycoprotein beta-1,4-N-acetylglucosaminyltransferase [Candidatus Kentron sp. DK]
MKIIDGFPFYDELELLDFRLKELGPYVDHFVLVESPITFSGKPKPLYFEENKERFKDFLPRIKHVVIPPHIGVRKEGPFARDELAYYYIYRGILDLHPHGEDVILLSDLDEIPDTEHVINEIVPMLLGNKVIKVRPHWFNFHIDNYLGHGQHASMTNTRFRAMERFMNDDSAEPRLIPGEEWPEAMGWHFSYFLPPERIINKLLAYSHWNDEKDRALIERVKKNGLDEIRKIAGKGGDLFGNIEKRPFYGRYPKTEVPRLI